MRLSRKQIHFRNLLTKLLCWSIKNDIDFSIGEVYRPAHLRFKCPHCNREFIFDLQDVYRYMGYSKARHSKHQDKLAVDIFILDKEGNWLKEKIHYEKLGEYWKKLDPYNRWGGDFELVDPYHFEYNG